MNHRVILENLSPVQGNRALPLGDPSWGHIVAARSGYCVERSVEWTDC